MLMNSFATSADTLSHLQRCHRGLGVAGVRVVADGLGPNVVRLQRRARHHAVAAAGAAGVHLLFINLCVGDVLGPVYERPLDCCSLEACCAVILWFFRAVALSFACARTRYTAA